METKRLDKVQALRSWASGRSMPKVARLENEVFFAKVEKPERERIRLKDMGKEITQSVERNLKVASKMAKHYPELASNKIAMAKQVDAPAVKKLSKRELRERHRQNVRFELSR